MNVTYDPKCFKLNLAQNRFSSTAKVHRRVPIQIKFSSTPYSRFSRLSDLSFFFPLSHLLFLHAFASKEEHEEGEEEENGSCVCLKPRILRRLYRVSLTTMYVRLPSSILCLDPTTVNTTMSIGVQRFFYTFFFTWLFKNFFFSFPNDTRKKKKSLQ